MAAGDFLDLMAFARGAQQANTENWQDTLNDISARSREEALRQSQTAYDLALPGAQRGAEEAEKGAIGLQKGQDFQTSVLTEADKLPPAQRAQFIADSAIRRLQNIDPMAPGAAQERNSIESFLKVQAGGLAKANPDQAATLYGATTTGGAAADSLRKLAMLSDPKLAFDPINLANLANEYGGTYDQATNTVKLPGSGGSMPVEGFVGMARQRVVDQTADLTPGFQRASNQDQQGTFADQQIAYLKSIGITAFKNPVTNQVVLMPQGGAGAGAGVPRQTAPAYPQAPGPQVPVPGQQAPTVAGAAPAYAQNPNVPVPNVPVPETLPSAPANPWDAAGSALDQAKIYRQGIETALRSFGLRQRAEMPQAYAYYQQELERAKAAENQASASYQAAVPQNATQPYITNPSRWITR